MTDSCFLPTCQEPRQHGVIACDVHWSLVPKKRQVEFTFILGRMMKNIGTPREQRSAEDFKAIRTTVQELIYEAVAAHQELP